MTTRALFATVSTVFATVASLLVMLPASAQPIDDSANTAMPHSTTGRRPKLSDNAPWNRFITAKPSR